MTRARTSRWIAAALVAVLALLAAGCAPPPPAEPIDWGFKATEIYSADDQEGVYLFGSCIANCNDEPYVLNIAFRVRVGEPGSAQAWVVKGADMGGVAQHETHTLSAAESGLVTFEGVRPLDVLGALDPANKFEVVGTYTWSVESDQITAPITAAADVIADRMQDSLEALAGGTVPTQNPQGLLDMIFGALTDLDTWAVIGANLPCAGLCDDVMAGRLYIGLGATGDLAALLDPLLAAVPVPYIATPAEVPPSIQGGAIYTMADTRNFLDESFSGRGGHYLWDFQAGVQTPPV